MVAFWIKSNLWEHEVRNMLSLYPDAQWCEVMEDWVSTRAWRLSMIPIPNKEELAYILADLNVGIGVSIGQQGKIQHSDKQCGVPSKDHPTLLPRLRLLQQIYLIELVYRPPMKFAVGSTQPKVRIISPEISARTYPSHPHMYVNSEFRNDSWACPLSPQNTQWRWGEEATVKYLDQVAIWLLKTAVWIATGAGITGHGKWIGPYTSHDPISLLSTIKQTDPCWCGSGLYYEKCHLQFDVKKTVLKKTILS